MVFRKVDPETCLFIEDFVADMHPALPDGTPDPAYIETPVPPDAGFILPRWNGETWEEGGTPPELNTSPPDPSDAEWRAQIEAALIELAAIATGGV